MKKPKSTRRDFIDDFMDFTEFMSPGKTLNDLKRVKASLDRLMGKNKDEKNDNEENDKKENDKKENLNIPSVIFSLFSFWIFVLKTLLESKIGRIIVIVALLGAFIMPIVGYFLST